mgnify:FL=1
MSRNVGSQMDGENENFFIRQCENWLQLLFDVLY